MAMKEALLIIGATVMSFACDRSQDREPPGSVPSATPSTPIATIPVTPAVPPAAAPPTVSRATFTDAQTLAVLDAANAAEVEQSNEAVNARATDFDRHYVEAMIDEHHALLDMIETKLLPSAQNPELKNKLEKIRDEVRDHIQMARDVRVALSKA